MRRCPWVPEVPSLTRDARSVTTAQLFAASCVVAFDSFGAPYLWWGVAGRRERLVAEFAQDVVCAAAEFACDREAGAVVVESAYDLEVVRWSGEPWRAAHWAASNRAQRSTDGP